MRLTTLSTIWDVKADVTMAHTGRQHDVSECMDNCVFQIETALLKFDGMDESEDGKSSVVKRCVVFPHFAPNPTKT